MSNTKKKKMDLEAVSFTNTVAIESLINVLERKGIITKEEILGEIKKISRNVAQTFKEKENG